MTIMVNKAIIVVALALVAIIVAASAFALVLQNNNGNTTTPSTSPTTPPSLNIANASSIAFSVNDTSQGVTTTYKFTAQNLNTANIALRVEVPGCDTGLNYTYVLKTDTQSVFSQINGGAWTAENFSSQWPLWGNMLSGYVQKLDTWNSIHPYSYTASNGDPILIFDISVNPTIPASTFQTS